MKSFPSRMAEYLPQILDPVWLALTHNAETYPFFCTFYGSLGNYVIRLPNIGERFGLGF